MTWLLGILLLLDWSSGASFLPPLYCPNSSFSADISNSSTTVSFASAGASGVCASLLYPFSQVYFYVSIPSNVGLTTFNLTCLGINGSSLSFEESFLLSAGEILVINGPFLTNLDSRITYDMVISANDEVPENVTYTLDFWMVFLDSNCPPVAWSSDISDPFSYIGSTRTYALTFPYNTTLSSIAKIGISQGSLIPYTDLYVGFNRVPEVANASSYDLHLAISPEPNSTVFSPQSQNGRDYPPTDGGTTWSLRLTSRFLTFKANPSSTNQFYNGAVAVWASLQPSCPLACFLHGSCLAVPPTTGDVYQSNCFCNKLYSGELCTGWFPGVYPALVAAGVGFLLAVWAFYSTVCCIVKQTHQPEERLLLESEVM